MSTFKFPKWSNSIRPVVGVAALIPAYFLFLIYYGFAPSTTDVGYAPKQPVPYSHAMHAGELGIDCRYCHNTVDQSKQASIPPTQTCMNCHTNIRPDSEKLLAVRESFASGMPVEWVRVHDLPDFVYFNHSAHVTRGVSCVSCHGRIDKMEVVEQKKPLSMGWCLDCHRNPEKFLRPLDKVYDLGWAPEEDQLVIGARIKELYKLNPSTDCSTCHR
ncbi:cytochrome c family protein [bacterium]|nr:cytochrome c family protein [bacterium]